MTDPQPRRAVAIPRGALAVTIASSIVTVAVGIIIFVLAAADETSDGGGPIPSALRFTATPAGDPFPSLTETLVLVGDDNLRVVIADDEAERGQGLRERETLGRYDGMLFVYADDGARSFTMSTVPVALDIGFYDARGKLVNRFRMEPCAGSDADCPSYPSDVDFRYAIETLAGDLPEGRLRAS